MHPRAVYCALHGLLPMIAFSVSGNFRIRWQRNPDEKQLHWYKTLWGIRDGTDLCEYTEIKWEDIPDEIMDALPLELIESLVFNYAV